MYWRVRLHDQHGRFWLQSDKKWSDAAEDGQIFKTREAADQAVARAKARAKRTEEWFPIIKAVPFKGDEAHG
jgi:hypothetical protein